MTGSGGFLVGGGPGLAAAAGGAQKPVCTGRMEHRAGAGGLSGTRPGQAVTGSQAGRDRSKAVISSVWVSVRPMSSRPSISRQRV